MIIEVHADHPNPRRIRQAVDQLERGGIIAYPTDTVYAVGCSIRDKRAVEKIHKIKADKAGTSTQQRLSIIVPDLSAISEWAIVHDAQYRLLRRATPGAYTFVLPASRAVPRAMLTRQKTIGIRVPDARVPMALCEALGAPLVTTSATGADGELLVTPREIEEQYGDLVDVILDAGPIVPMPSTIIDLCGDEPAVLRMGKGDVTSLGLEAP